MTAVHPNMRTDPYVNQALAPLGKKLLDRSGPGYRLTLWDFRDTPPAPNEPPTTKASPPPTATKAGDGVGD